MHGDAVTRVPGSESIGELQSGGAPGAGEILLHGECLGEVVRESEQSRLHTSLSAPPRIECTTRRDGPGDARREELHEAVLVDPVLRQPRSAESLAHVVECRGHGVELRVAVRPLTAHQRVQDEESTRLCAVDTVVGDAPIRDDGESEQGDALDAYGACLS